MEIMKISLSKDEIIKLLLNPPLDNNNRYLWKPMEIGDAKNIAEALTKDK